MDLALRGKSKEELMYRKGVVLVVVIGVLIVIFTLALVAMYVMTQDARLAEHKIRRMRATFAAKAGMVHALEQARNGRYNCGQPQCVETINIGAGIDGYPEEGLPVTITFNTAATGPMNTHRIDIRVNY